MEQRWNRRVKIALDVVLYYKGIPIAICKTRDVSLDGIFIVAEPDLMRFHKQTCLEVEITLKTKIKPRSVRLPVVATRRGDDGIGLKFVGPDAGFPNTIQSLNEHRRKGNGQKPHEAVGTRANGARRRKSWTLADLAWIPI